MVSKIYFDLDGVLADFDRGVLEQLGITPMSYNTATKEYTQLLWSTMSAEAPHFYKNLYPVADMDDLFLRVYEQYGDKVEILTGLPRKETMPYAEQDKRDWVANWLHPSVVVNAVQTWEKPKFIKDNGCILIDDSTKTMQKWYDKGGWGVLYLSPIQTLLSLREIFETLDGGVVYEYI